jgi:hypothetical protein
MHIGNYIPGEGRQFTEGPDIIETLLMKTLLKIKKK